MNLNLENYQLDFYKEKDSCSYVPRDISELKDSYASENENRAEIINDFFELVINSPSRVTAATKIRKELFSVFETDKDIGIMMWKLWIKMTLYKRRNQDAGEGTLFELGSEFGHPYAIEILKQDDELVDLLFRFSNHPPLMYLRKKVEDIELIQKCLIAFSKNNFNYVLANAPEIYDDPSLYKYHNQTSGLSPLTTKTEIGWLLSKIEGSPSFALDFFVNLFADFPDKNKTYVNDSGSSNFQYIFTFPHEEKSIPLPSSCTVNPTYKKEVEDYFLGASCFGEYTNAIVDSIDYLQSMYPYVFVFSPIYRKNDLINTYLAEHADFYTMLPPLIDVVPDINYICGFSHENIIYYDALSFYGQIGCKIVDFPVTEHKPAFYRVWKPPVIDTQKKAESISNTLAQYNHSESAEQIENSMEKLVAKFEQLRNAVIEAVHCGITKIDYNAVKALRNNIFEELIKTGRYQTKWIHERELYDHIKFFYPDALFQYKASWLNGQIYDIYIPSLCLAVEYQGAQHYQPVDYFGGEDCYQDCLRRDERKLNLSKEYGVEIKYWKYTEPINIHSVKSFLQTN